MLQTVMQQNLLFYGIGILCFFGVISQIWLWGIYSRMTKDMENERAAKGKFIRQIRQRYGLLKRMGDGSVNTRAFIERSLYQYRHLGRTLHQWRRTGAVALVLSLILGLVGYYYAGNLRMGAALRQNYLWAMGIAAAVMGLIYGLTDVRYRRSYLETGLLDMLENSGNTAAVVKNGKQSASPEKVSRPFPRRANRRTAAGSRVLLLLRRPLRQRTSFPSEKIKRQPSKCSRKRRISRQISHGFVPP